MDDLEDVIKRELFLHLFSTVEDSIGSVGQSIDGKPVPHVRNPPPIVTLASMQQQPSISGANVGRPCGGLFAGRKKTSSVWAPPPPAPMDGQRTETQLTTSSQHAISLEPSTVLPAPKEGQAKLDQLQSPEASQSAISSEQSIPSTQDTAVVGGSTSITHDVVVLGALGPFIQDAAVLGSSSPFTRDAALPGEVSTGLSSLTAKNCNKAPRGIPRRPFTSEPFCSPVQEYTQSPLLSPSDLNDQPGDSEEITAFKTLRRQTYLDLLEANRAVDDRLQRFRFDESRRMYKDHEAKCQAEKMRLKEEISWLKKIVDAKSMDELRELDAAQKKWETGQGASVTQSSAINFQTLEDMMNRLFAKNRKKRAKERPKTTTPPDTLLLLPQYPPAPQPSAVGLQACGEMMTRLLAESLPEFPAIDPQAFEDMMKRHLAENREMLMAEMAANHQKLLDETALIVKDQVELISPAIGDKSLELVVNRCLIPFGGKMLTDMEGIVEDRLKSLSAPAGDKTFEVAVNRCLIPFGGKILRDMGGIVDKNLRNIPAPPIVPQAPSKPSSREMMDIKLTKEPVAKLPKINTVRNGPGRPPKHSKKMLSPTEIEKKNGRD